MSRRPHWAPWDSGSFCSALTQPKSINEGEDGLQGWCVCPVWDVEAKGIQVLRGWYRCEQQLVCRSPGKLGRGSSFAVPEESQQDPPEVLSLIHLHLYFSWRGSSDEQS